MPQLTRPGLPIVFASIFVLFSLPFIAIGGYFGYENYLLTTHGTKTTGQVIELVSSYSSKGGRTYAPVFEFVTPDQQSHTVRSHVYSNPASFSVGERVNILYPTNKPEEAEINSFTQLWLLPLVFVIVGGIMFLIGAGMIVVTIRNSLTKRWLKEHGQRVITTFQSVEHKTNFRVNGQSPYQIFTTWTDPMTQQTITLKSDYLWQDPTPALQGRTTVEALVDPANPKRHWIDLNSLNLV